jgi:adenosylmethionine-8-amino-7-oxononanoate aminotransferase
MVRVTAVSEIGALFKPDVGGSYPVLVRGEGCFVEDVEGRRYLDAAAGVGVMALGYGVEELVQAQLAQARALPYAHSLRFSTVPQQRLAERFSEIAPTGMSHAFFVSGGSEALESAIKLARSYHVQRGDTGRSVILGRNLSFHGNTLAALAAGGMPLRQRMYRPMLQDWPKVVEVNCYRCPLGLNYPSCGIACADDLETVINRTGPERVAAFVAEPVVGAAAGATVPPEGYFEQIRAICDRHGVLFIADEVFTGIGRTGRWFGIEHSAAVPDILYTAKGLGAGYASLAGVALHERVAEAFVRGDQRFEHNFTMAGNPLACAVGLKVLEIIERDGLVEAAARKGRLLQERLRQALDAEVIGEVRGRGLLVGIELVQDQAAKQPFPADLRAAARLDHICREMGLLIYPGTGTAGGEAGDHVLLIPPLTISEAELDQVVQTLAAATRRLARELRV